MTARTILSLAPRLSLSEQEVQAFIQKANGRRRRYSSNAHDLQVLQEIENEHLLQLMEWYHLAVLELVGLKDFQANAAWISERLMISQEQAQAAIDDLMTAGVLSQREDGLWKTEIKNHSVSSKKNPRAQLVKQQIYNQAIALLPNHIGEHGTTTVCVSETRLAEASERIARFRRELSQFLSEPEDKHRVYQLVISLFPVSK